MKILVLGAGVVGVTSAWYLNKAGHDVTVIDRRPAAGLETSFANGGQISVSHAEPWANPSAPLKVLKWLFDPEAPLLFRPQLDVRQWLWIAQFLVDCLPHRVHRHTIEIVRLATESRALLQKIRAIENLHYDERSRGILHFYRDQREFEAAIPVAELMRRYGCNRNVIDRDKILELEPALTASIDKIVGATYTAEDESGDAFKYTQALADICARKGATFLYGSEAVALRVKSPEARVGGIEVRTPEGYRVLTARDIVVSLGSYSAPFLRPYRVSLNV